MASVRKTREQIVAERAAALKAFEKYQRTRPSKEAIAARNNAPIKPMTAAERAARTQAMETKKRKIMQERQKVNRSAVKPAPLGVAPKAPRRETATPAPLGLAPKTKPRPLGLAPKTKPKPLGLYKK